MAVLMIVALAAASAPLTAQWFKYPSPRAPRTAGGDVDLSAATPRLPNGRPDLSGVWMTAEPACVIRGVLTLSELVKLLPPTRKCPPRTASFSRHSVNMGIDMPGGLPYQPWLAKLVDERTANQSIDDPHIRCLPDLFVRAYGLPHYLKFVQTPDLLVMMNEYNGVYRQVFTDGRPLPNDPNPSWQGYSTAAWSGDTLVIDTIGFRDDVWLDWAGSMITSAGKEHDGDGNFGDDQRASRAGARPRAMRAAARGPQSMVEIGRRGVQRGDHTKHHTGQERQAKGHAEDRSVDGHIAQPRQIGRCDRDQGPDSGRGESQPHDTPDERNDEAFGQDLPGDAESSGAECRSHGQLRVTRGDPAKGEARDVGAGD